MSVQQNGKNSPADASTSRSDQTAAETTGMDSEARAGSVRSSRDITHTISCHVKYYDHDVILLHELICE